MHQWSVAIAVSIGLALVFALAARASIDRPAAAAGAVSKMIAGADKATSESESSHLARFAARVGDKVNR